MLALWMYLMKNIDQISVLKFQELAYRMIRALLMRKEVLIRTKHVRAVVYLVVVLKYTVRICVCPRMEREIETKE